ncbi:MAG: hypothetical protein HUU30_10755 [Burkholderiaceae bacterium]|nr:hypothetical protein [Burkholderiaceae bacterium]
MTRWTAVCSLDDLPPLGARRIARAQGLPVAVFRAHDDRVYALLDRVLYMQEMAEKTEVDETLRAIDHALRLEAASRLARGAEPRRQPLERENPVKWLQMPPRNYLGEMDKPPAQARPPYWYFDSEEKQLVYQPNRKDHLSVAGQKGQTLRFNVQNGENALNSRLVSRFSYTWF